MTPEQTRYFYDQGRNAALTDEHLLAVADWALTHRQDLDAPMVEPPALTGRQHPHTHEAA